MIVAGSGMLGLEERMEGDDDDGRCLGVYVWEVA